VKKIVVIIGKCGIACGLCKNFNNGCLGCEKENIYRHVCIIFNCAENKNIECCLKCDDYPCKLMKVSKSYCPVFTLIKMNL